MAAFDRIKLLRLSKHLHQVPRRPSNLAPGIKTRFKEFNREI